MKYTGEEEVKGSNATGGRSLMCGAQAMVHSEKNRETRVLELERTSPAALAEVFPSDTTRLLLPASRCLPSAFRESPGPDLSLGTELVFPPVDDQIAHNYSFGVPSDCHATCLVSCLSSGKLSANSPFRQASPAAQP